MELLPTLLTFLSITRSKFLVSSKATQPLLDREAPGLTVAMISKSLAITPMAMLSRWVMSITVLAHYAGEHSSMLYFWLGRSCTFPGHFDHHGHKSTNQISEQFEFCFLIGATSVKLAKWMLLNGWNFIWKWPAAEALHPIEWTQLHAEYSAVFYRTTDQWNRFTNWLPSCSLSQDLLQSYSKLSLVPRPIFANITAGEKYVILVKIGLGKRLQQARLWGGTHVWEWG